MVCPFYFMYYSFAAVSFFADGVIGLAKFVITSLFRDCDCWWLCCGLGLGVAVCIVALGTMLEEWWCDIFVQMISETKLIIKTIWRPERRVKCDEILG